MNKTQSFLKELKKNNNRVWFQEHKEEYLESQLEMIEFADRLLEGVRQFDQIETISGKKSLFRIYRDIRFSKLKLPYKTNRSGSFKREGSMRRGGYYFSIEPGKSMIGGGFYGPNSDDLKHIRNQIQSDSEPLLEVLSQGDFKSYFGELQGERLKTSPRGFSEDDPSIELLRYKNFYVMHPFTDKEVLSNDFSELATNGFKKLLPFFEVMSNYLTTDLNGELMVSR